MIVEIINNEIENGVVVKTKNGFKLVSNKEFFKEHDDKVKELTNQLEDAEKKLAAIEEANLEGKLEEYKKKNEILMVNIARFIAFEILNDDINYNGKDYPENYEEIKEYVFNPKGKKVPAGFENYLNKIEEE